MAGRYRPGKVHDETAGAGKISVTAEKYSPDEERSRMTVPEITNFAVEHSPEEIYFVDREGVMIYANTAARTSFGLTPGTVPKTRIFDINPTITPEKWEEIMAEITLNGYLQFESLHRRSDGTAYPVEVSKYSVESDGVVSFCVIARDITERRESEQKFLEQKNILNERVKELKCLFGIANLVEKNLSDVDFLQGVADLIPPSWQYPDETCARINVDGRIFKSDNFQESIWKQSSNIIIRGRDAGRIDVYYYGGKIFSDGPFLDEEAALLRAITERVGRIIERRQAEGALQESEEKYRSLFDTMAQGVLYYDSEGRVLSANPSAERIFGRNISEIKKIPFVEPELKLIHEDGSDYLWDSRPSIKALRTGLKWRDTMGVYNPAVGRYRWIVVNATPQFSHGEDRPFQVYTTIEDITDRKEAEEALRKSEELLNEVGKLASVGGWEFDVTTGGVRWTPEAQRIHETGSALLDMSDSVLLYDMPGRTALEKALHRCVEEGKAYDLELPFTSAKGRNLWIRNMGRAVRSNGRIVKVTGFIQDITERKRAENTLKTINKKLNILGSITRHDIINQLSAALMYVELMESGRDINPGSKTANDLKKITGILKEIERQIAFTRDYQDLGVYSPEWFNVGEIIEATECTVQKMLTVENEVNNIEVFADPLFKKVIYTFFENAARHGESVTTIRFRSEQVPDGIKIICEDDGAGVPDDVKEKIFNRQYYKHTGLGLFLSREILSITGMSVAETGTFGKGARFEILVPERSYRFVSN